MNFSDLIIGAVIGVVGYKLGESVQRIRQERDDSEYGLSDLVGEAFENFVNESGLERSSKGIRGGA